MALKIDIKEDGYNIKVGAVKMIKNGAIFLLPSLVAYQASVPQEYAWILAGAVYMIKNWLENKDL